MKNVFSLVNCGHISVSMLVLTSQATSSEELTSEEDRFSPQFVLDLLLGMIRNIVRDQILNILGITTTQATPILDALNGVPIIGALIPDKPTTTTTTEGPTSSTSPGAPGWVNGWGRAGREFKVKYFQSGYWSHWRHHWSPWSYNRRGPTRSTFYYNHHHHHTNYNNNNCQMWRTVWWRTSGMLR